MTDMNCNGASLHLDAVGVESTVTVCLDEVRWCDLTFAMLSS